MWTRSKSHRPMTTRFAKLASLLDMNPLRCDGSFYPRKHRRRGRIVISVNPEKASTPTKHLLRESERIKAGTEPSTSTCSRTEKTHPDSLLISLHVALGA
jgi:hypothetical protein